MKNSNKYILPLIIIGILFFVVGFALGINSYIVPLLQESLHLSSGQSYMALAATFIAFLVFSYPATWLITKIGYKKTILASFAIFAIGFQMFVPSARQYNLVMFLVASFVCGIANTTLQAAINPYVTFLGPIESAARRISIMGIFNILAWPASPLFLSWLIGKNVNNIELSDIIVPFYVISGIFVVLGIFIYFSPLKEMKFEGEGEDEETSGTALPDRGSFWHYPHAVFGAIALFMYVGIETISMATSVDYATSIGLANPESYATIPALGMVAGYIFGIIMIPRRLSQSSALRIHSWIAIIGVLAVILLPMQYSIYAVFIVTFGCSVMYPAIWPLALDGLGKYTKTGSSVLVSCIVGGSLLPLAYGFLKDAVGAQAAYWIGIPCFAIVLIYAYWGYKLKKY